MGKRERRNKRKREKIKHHTSGLKEKGRKFPPLTGWSSMLQKKRKRKVKEERGKRKRKREREKEFVERKEKGRRKEKREKG